MQSPKAFMLAAHGAKMPAIGYSTMELPQRGTELVAYAIQSGYRLIDTARKYGTEEKVGNETAGVRHPGGRCGGVLANVHRNVIVKLAAANRLPAVYPFRLFAAAGGLMFYGNDRLEPWRGAAG